MKQLIFCICCTFITNIYAQIPNSLQTTCITPDLVSQPYIKSAAAGCNTVNTWSGTFDNSYKPLSTFPDYVIRLNFIFLQRNDGSGNFDENNLEHQQDIDELITNTCQSTYSAMVNPNSTICYTGTDFIANAKIKFLVNKIFIKDSHGWNNRYDNRLLKMCPYENSWYLDYLDNQICSNTNIPRGVNVYFTEDSINYVNLVENRTTNVYVGANYACSQEPSFVNFSRSSRIHMPDLYSKYWAMKNILPFTGTYAGTPWIPTARSWYCSTGKTLAHELIHTFNIPHDYNCNNSIANPSGSAVLNYLRPTEIGRIFAALSLSNLRTFVKEDTYNPVPLTISSTDTWNYEIRTYWDINIVSSGNLTVTCKMIVPNQSTIFVKSLGKLTIDNTQIQSVTNTWNGITIENGGYLLIKNTTIKDYSIKVKSGGTLHIKGNLTILGNNSITVENGAYVCIESPSTIQLTDFNSVINLRPGYINGVNPSLGFTSNCVASPATYATTGNGKINTYLSTIFIQNETLTGNQYRSGSTISAGTNVTNTKPQGPVVVKSASNIVFDAEGNIILDKGFEVESGALLEAK